MTHKVVIVTGASQGIGADLVRAYRDIDYRVIANSRSIAGDAFDGDPGVIAVAGDIAEPATAGRIVSAATERFGRIDTIVNNAGVLLVKPFVDVTYADFERICSVNIVGFFRLTQAVASHMLAAASGHIISITSSLAEQPLSSVPAALTTLTKGGLNAITRALALEYAGRGIRVNAVSPGPINTPMHTPEASEFLARLTPLKRMGRTADVVKAVLYLESADFVTGEILHVDGGAQAGSG